MVSDFVTYKVCLLFVIFPLLHVFVHFLEREREEQGGGYWVGRKMGQIWKEWGRGNHLKNILYEKIFNRTHLSSNPPKKNSS